MHDGARQAAPLPYSDDTGYQPVNHPDTCRDPLRWQPKYFSDGQGGQFAPACLTPHWHLVKPLLIAAADAFRPGPPPAPNSPQLRAELEEVIALSASLSPADKALVEFMRDGPHSVQQAGHWVLFAQHVSRRDRHTLDDDVKLYFLVAAVAMDAFIAAWDAKMHYDYARPYALIHTFYRDQEIAAWGGPGQGTVRMPGQAWRPYSPETFLCPPLSFLCLRA